LHIIPRFAPGGAEVRTTGLINSFGPKFRHTIVSLDGDLSAGERIGPSIEINYATVTHARNPVLAIAHLRRLIRSCRPDLVLTYNWGSIDGFVAAAFGSGVPVIHTEDGFGPEEALGQKFRRVLTRRLALRRAYRVIAPSRTLVDIMRNTWKLPEDRIEFIPNGIDIETFGPGERARSFGIPPGRIVVGSVGSLTTTKRHDLLIDLCAAVSNGCQITLLIAGEGPARGALERKAKSLGLDLVLPGFQKDPRQVYRSVDLFALTSRTEQMPLSLLEAMSCGLPVLSTDVGDVREMVSADNRPFVTSDRDGLISGLATLLGDEKLRQSLGAANRSRAVQHYGIARMLERYRGLYEGALRTHRG
jgi:glycosyltransferase involved in cell wall biosynthesis